MYLSTFHHSSLIRPGLWKWIFSGYMPTPKSFSKWYIVTNNIPAECVNCSSTGARNDRANQ